MAEEQASRAPAGVELRAKSLSALRHAGRRARPLDVPRGLRAAALAALVAASSTLAIVQWWAPGPVDLLIGQNQLDLRHRTVGLLLAAGAASLAGGAAAIFSVGGALESCERWARLLSPLLVSAFVPALLARSPWSGRELQHLTAVLCFALVVERLLRVSFRAWRRSDVVHVARALRRVPVRLEGFLPIAIVLLGAAYYAVMVSHYTLLNHDRLATTTADLGEFDNLFFNALHGHPFRAVTTLSDLRDWHGLRVHAELALYLLLPFYALAPGPRALLVIQAVIVAATALPVYWLAARRIGRSAGVIVAFSLLLLPVVQRPNFYDFHMTPLAMLLVAWVFVALDVYLAKPRAERAPFGVLLGVSVALALSVREDVAIGLAVLGIWLMLAHRPAPHAAVGAALAASALGYFAVTQLWLMPSFGSSWFHGLYEDLKAPGAARFSAVILTLFSNPAYVVSTLLTEPKLLYVLHMTAPLAALWARRPWLLAAALPGFASTLLVTNRPPMFQSSFQYTYLWVPYIVGASVLAIGSLSGRGGPLERRAVKAGALGALLVAAVAASYQHGALLGASRILGGFGYKQLSSISDDERRELEQLRRLTRRIPPSASVSATEDVGPHLSTRLVFFHMTHGQPDYVVVGRLHGDAERAYVRRVVESGEYRRIGHEGRFILLERRGEPRSGRSADAPGQ